MPRFDPERIQRIVSQMRVAVQHLKDLSELSKDEFLSDVDKIGSAKYHLIVVIESCVDIAHHLISRNGFRAPLDYMDTFAILSEQGILDEELATKMKRMARFRNRLVHLYWDIEDARIYEILKKRP